MRFSIRIEKQADFETNFSAKYVDKNNLVELKSGCDSKELFCRVAG